VQPIIRACLFLSFVLVFSSAALIDCYWHVGFEVRYVNNTDAGLCVYDSTSGPPRGVGTRGCNKIEAHENKTYSHGYCDRPEEEWWLLVTDGPGGQHIYLSSLTCEQWQHSDPTITIDRVAGRFVVSEDLPNLATPSPAD